MKYAITIQEYKSGKPDYMIDRLIGPFDSVADAEQHMHRTYEKVKPISSKYHVYEAVGANICLQILELIDVSNVRRFVHDASNVRRVVEIGPYQTFSGWRRAAKEHGAVRFEGGKDDIAQAWDSSGNFSVGEWDGVVGFVFVRK